MQIIRHRLRMDEIELRLKHVPIQETIYRSILMRSRKEIHPAVARAIEELGNAEEYLEKAGKAAMDSAASSEALVFLQDALDLNKRKSVRDASPERLAQLERTIAKAFQNKGLMQKAVEHYDLALEHIGVRRRGLIGKIAAVATGYLSILRFLYLPVTRSRKKPTPREVEIIRIMVDREWAVSNVDTTEFFLSGFRPVRRLLSRDPFCVPSGLSLLCIISQLLSVTGLSFPLANRILDFVGPNLKSDLDRSVFYDAEQFLHLLSGTRDCRFRREDMQEAAVVADGLRALVAKERIPLPSRCCRP